MIDDSRIIKTATLSNSNSVIGCEVGISIFPKEVKAYSPLFDSLILHHHNNTTLFQRGLLICVLPLFAGRNTTSCSS
jgi:hypothetical protein